MSVSSTTLYHPLNGSAEETWEGFSWPAFFFGVFWLLVKGLYGQAVISFLLAICTFGFAVPLIWIAYGFMGNDIHKKSLIKKGYLRRDQLDESDKRFKSNDAVTRKVGNLTTAEEEIEKRFIDGIFWGNFDEMRHMLAEKQIEANSDSQRAGGWLQMAARRARKEACEILIEFGADPKRTDKQGQTAVGIAEAMGNNELIEIFLGVVDKGPTSQVDGENRQSDLPGLIRQLAELKASGVLAEEEFQAAKAKLLR